MKQVLIGRRRRKILFRRTSAVLLVLISFLATRTLYAQENESEDSDTNISERINFIQTAFDEGETRAKIWSYSWTGVYGMLTGVQTAQALYTSHNRTSNIVYASQSLLGFAALIVDPLHARSSGRDLREIPGDTPDERQLKLETAERWLERNAKQEKFGRSWPVHILALAVNAIGGAIIWHNSGSKDGLTSILAGMAAAEVQIWTQPTRAIKDYDEYRSKYKGAKNSLSDRKYFIAPSPNGCVAGFIF